MIKPTLILCFDDNCSKYFSKLPSTITDLTMINDLLTWKELLLIKKYIFLETSKLELLTSPNKNKSACEFVCFEKF